MTCTHLTSFAISLITWVGHQPQCHSLGINHISLNISIISGLAFLLVVWSKDLPNFFLTSQSPRHYVIINKLLHNNLHTYLK